MADELEISKDLIDLANSPQVTRIRDFPATASSLDADELLGMYKALRDTAPHRHARDKKYFVGHTGVPSTKGASNRIEEHLAIALCKNMAGLPLGDSDELDLLDYQVALKARRADAGVGKVDILGATASGRIAVAELKVTTDSSKGDNPLRALLESLAYCAIVEANASDISNEIKDRFFIDTAAGRPVQVVMGPDRYWSARAHTPLSAVFELSDRLARSFDMQIWFLDLGDIDVVPGSDGTEPQLIGKISTTVLHTSSAASCTRHHRRSRNSLDPGDSIWRIGGDVER